MSKRLQKMINENKIPNKGGVFIDAYNQSIMEDSHRNFKNPQCGRIYSANGLSPTINTCQSGNREPKILQLGRGFNKGGVKEISPTITSNSFECNNFVIGSMQKNAYRGSTDGVSPTITAACGMGGGQTPMVGCSSRIRKLTPRECFRLMGVSEKT